MINKLITNSLDELKDFKQLNNLESTIIYTSNYYIYKYCISNKYKSVMIDELVSEEEFNRISKLAFKFENILFEKLYNQYFAFYKNLNIAIRKSNFHILNSTLYFSLVVKRIKNEKFNNFKIFYYKNHNYNNESPLDPSYKRYDKIFSYLLDGLNEKNIIPLEPIKYKLKKEKNSYKISKFIFKIFYNTKSSFLFKVWRSRYFYNIYLLIFSILKFKKHYIYDPYEANELMQEIFIEILKKKILLTKLNKFDYKFKTPEKKSKHQNEIKKILSEIIFKSEILNFFEIDTILIKSITNIISLKISSVYCYYDSNNNELNNYFKLKFNKLKRGDKILSRGYFRSYEILMYFYLKDKEIENIVFEHGITHGFCYHTKYIQDYYALMFSDKTIFLNPLSMKFLNKENYKSYYFSGIPNIFKTNFLKKLINPKIIKSLLKLKSSKTIIFAPFPEINNYIFGPYYPRDISIFENFRIIEYLCTKYSDHDIVLKLYPSNRFIDNYSYEDLAKKYTNLKIIKNLDLRYITFLSDKIFTTLPTSTIGIIHKSKIDGYYLQYNWNPIYLDKGHFKIDIKNIINVFKISKFTELEYKWNVDFIKEIL